MLVLRGGGVFMFAWEIIESFLFIAVITAAIVWYGVAIGRKEDRDAGSPTDILGRSHAVGESNHESRKKTA